MKRFFFLSMLLFGFSGVFSSFISAKQGSRENYGRWILWSEYPATSWEHAFVTGNGKLGTMVLGHPTEERIICVHEELFIRDWNRHKVTVPVTSHLLPEVRKQMNAGQSDKASRIVTDEADRQLKAMGASNRWPLIPHPAFDLRIRTTEQDPDTTRYYRRQLNLETGEALVKWASKNGEMEERVFSSRKHNVNVIRLRSKHVKKLNTQLSLEETPGREGMHFDHNLDSAFLAIESNAIPGWLMYHAAYTKDPGGYDGLARVTTKGGKMKSDGKYLKIENADEILIVMRITPLENGAESEMESVKKELSRLPEQYDALLAPHSYEHGEMFRRMQLDLGCAKAWEETPTEKMLSMADRQGITPLFLEQVHAMGRYLLISSSGKYPPPLQGIWGGSWKPAWIGGFVWDSNINLAISAASMSNLPECAETYYNYVKNLLPGWRLNAKNYLGCRGFIVAHYNDPENGYLTHFGGSFPWMFWAGGAGWNIRPIYEFAMMTGDDRFLEQNVLPLYREIGEFYEDFLVMGKDNLYHICPSISPENAPPGTDTWLSRDATMDISIAREVFSLLCRMERKFNPDSENIRKWESFLNQLPFYRINEDGALAEWIDKTYPDVYNHRHNSHLYPLFPGRELRKCIKGGTDWSKAAGIALDKRFAFDTSSAHGLIHLALQAVQLGNADRAEENLDRFSRRGYLYDGLVTSHEPNHGIYNLDAVLSFPRLIMEMLVFTDSGRIELLPAWPHDYPDGTIKGMRLYGGHTLDLSWKSGKPVSITLHAGKNENFELSFHGKQQHLELEKGKKYILNF